MALSREQILEIDKANLALKDARTHLDNAMYRLGNMPDEEYNKVRKAYDCICRALDEF